MFKPIKNLPARKNKMKKERKEKRKYSRFSNDWRTI